CWAEASSITPTSRPGLGRSANRRPEMVAVPSVGVVSPTIIRMDVDLPAPLGPRKPVTRPFRAVKEMSWTTVVPPYFLVSWSMVIMALTLGTTRGRPRRREVVFGRAPRPDGRSSQRRRRPRWSGCRALPAEEAGDPRGGDLH